MTRSPRKLCRSARTLAAGRAFVQNLRCGYCELATDSPLATGSSKHSTSLRWPSDEIRQALHRVTSGQAALDPAVQRHLVEAVAALSQGPPAQRDEPGAGQTPGQLPDRTHPPRGRCPHAG